MLRAGSHTRIHTFNMVSKTFLILRHGLATHNVDGYGEKILTATVLPEGIPPIKRMGAYLKTQKTDIHIVSEFIRCQKTAKIITGITGEKFTTDKRVNEFYEETFTNFKQRIIQFLDDIQTQKGETILICTHGAVIAGIKSILLTDSFTEDNLLDFPKTGVLTIIQNNLVRELDFN